MIDLDWIKTRELKPSKDALIELKDIKYFKFTESLKYISNIYLSKINSIIESIEWTLPWKYDELMIYNIEQFSSDEFWSPFYLNTPRNDNEWYTYENDCKRMLEIIKDKYRKWELELNKPILLENAPWTEIDIQIIIDIWFIIFLNKKSWEVSKFEFELIKPELYDLAFLFREKIFSKIF